MRRILLDTNALVWVSNSNKTRALGKQTRHLLATSEAIYFSSISIAEIQVKAMVGKIKISAGLSAETAVQSGLLELRFTSQHAEALENFPSLARHDPFDRMLLAQAQSEGLALVTSDSVLLGLGFSFVIDVKQ